MGKTTPHTEKMLTLDNPLGLLISTHEKEERIQGIQNNSQITKDLQDLWQKIPGLVYNDQGLHVSDSRIRLTVSKGYRFAYQRRFDPVSYFCKQYTFFWNDKQVALLQIFVCSWSTHSSVQYHKSHLNHEKLRLFITPKEYNRIDENMTQLILEFVS